MEPKPLTAYQQTYHWRNKNCAPFAYDWIKQSLPGLKVDDGQQSAEISSVTSVSGDCDLGQRKGKLLTIYDLEVQASWIGKTKDGNEIKGTLKVPEVSHEAIDGVSDYVYEFSITGGSSNASDELLVYIRKSFPPLLSGKLNSFRPALLAAHGSAAADAASTPGSGASTPAAYTPAPPTKNADEPIKGEEKREEKPMGATATVEVKADLQASADDLWGLLTDENKIPMWSRSAAKLSLKAGSPYELFGGNVRGKVISADPPKKLVQTWQVRSPGWPSEHYGTMSLSLSQGSDTTAATFTLEGVPAGTQADVEKALNSFYIQGLKQMGLVSSSLSTSFTTPIRPKQKKLRRKRPSSSWSNSSIIGGAAVVGLSALLIGVVYTSFPSSTSLPGMRQQ
ncbi:chaperone activator [Cryptococcus neoformans C23]|uniref:Chaperone activator n=1 Tax=Cryptococcus neoformans (strain H99 / ATCC 208821 / CBS 10515 / FGSC 9487) TaxID=235443 RepID=J9VIP1_CRYN9|nr:chaperone activator [Cryptococcus neoformans var. grubii H99]AUB21870.1 chaperone activator [Cryptococcus neoformans var. grubii]OWZ37025.1 chaperone activator [Cryptococcus neoformans var. grubii AD2-60a]OWZ48856.1 chaperone activator [Cryptococcus neoformans var. grubii C23]OXC87370.1 chaperone activator [Cryptococcus neoformans var. grubii AD1-7a]OXG41650.1 chaperone activator [Cryptococcus neoformans var. grubii Bt120]OXG54950.1 chaperone activator [Cryptococcus neoformans var. grubii |eukprot:XP_012046251.1 chaperone activator [Cryptococcus neoformans var. grubii H99]